MGVIGDMDKQTFVLRESYSKSYAENAVHAIEPDQDRPMVVTIQRYRTNRSNDQNNLYWKWMRVIASESGSDPLDIHEAMKMKFLEASEAVLPDGELVRVPGSSSKLKTDEFSEYLSQIQVWATEWGVHLPTLEEAMH